MLLIGRLGICCGARRRRQESSLNSQGRGRGCQGHDRFVRNLEQESLLGVGALTVVYKVGAASAGLSGQSSPNAMRGPRILHLAV
jgi:ABC-type protease/lipase transport system fused ATPase/permease subunit